MIMDSLKLPFKILDSELSGILSIDIDITDRVNLKNELKKSERVP